MPLVIHVGTQKTGTTSIQKFAAAHRPELRSRGLWYPSFREIGQFGHYAHHDFAHALADQGKRLDLALARTFVDAIEQNRRDGEVVLISAEPFYRHVLHPSAGEGAAGEDYWTARRRYIARMREFFPATDVRIVICLRRQDAFARSCYQEFVRSTRHDKGFEDFVVRAKELLDYRRNLDLLAEVFPRVDVLVFERLIADGQLVNRFFAHLGVNIGGLAVPERANPSLPFDLVEFKRSLNGTGMSDAALKRVGRLLPDIAAAHQATLAPEYDWAPPERLRAFQATFDAENEAIARDYLGESGTLFPTESRSLPVFPGLDSKRSTEISAQLLEFLIEAAEAAAGEPKREQGQEKRGRNHQAKNAR
jgi:hypothetical protein